MAYTYRVVEQKKKSLFRGPMTVEELEERINEHARDGWVLDRIVAGETASFMGFCDKDVFRIIFRKET